MSVITPRQPWSTPASSTSGRAVIDQRRCEAPIVTGMPRWRNRLPAAEGLAQLRHRLPGFGVLRLRFEPADQRALARLAVQAHQHHQLGADAHEPARRVRLPHDVRRLRFEVLEQQRDELPLAVGLAFRAQRARGAACAQEDGRDGDHGVARHQPGQQRRHRIVDLRDGRARGDADDDREGDGRRRERRQHEAAAGHQAQHHARDQDLGRGRSVREDGPGQRGPQRGQHARMHRALAHDARTDAGRHLVAMAQPAREAERAQGADQAAPRPAQPRRDVGGQRARQQHRAEDVGRHQPRRHERHPLHQAGADLGGFGVAAEVDLDQAAPCRPLGLGQRTGRRGRRVGFWMRHGRSRQGLPQSGGNLAGIGPLPANLTLAERPLCSTGRGSGRQSEHVLRSAGQQRRGPTRHPVGVARGRSRATSDARSGRPAWTRSRAPRGPAPRPGVRTARSSAQPRAACCGRRTAAPKACPASAPAPARRATARARCGCGSPRPRSPAPADARRCASCRRPSRRSAPAGRHPRSRSRAAANAAVPGRVRPRRRIRSGRASRTCGPGNRRPSPAARSTPPTARPACACAPRWRAGSRPGRRRRGRSSPSAIARPRSVGSGLPRRR